MPDAIMSLMHRLAHLIAFSIGEETNIHEHQRCAKPCQTKLLLHNHHPIIIQETQPRHLQLYLVTVVKYSLPVDGETQSAVLDRH